MKKSEAIELGNKMIHCVETGNNELAWQQLEPILEQKIPFAMLDNIANQYAFCNHNYLGEHLCFFEQLMYSEKLGVYPIIAQALVQFLSFDLPLSFKYAEKFIRMGNQWVVCDIFGERVLGQSLVRYYDEAYSFFQEYTKSDNAWMKRSVGVASHVFTKKTCKEEDKIDGLLNLLEALLDETNRDIVKGVGWGLKTIARYYPDKAMEYMNVQIFHHKISATVIRKFCTYLSEDKKKQIQKWYQESKLK